MGSEAVVVTATNFSKVRICLGKSSPTLLEGDLGEEQGHDNGDENEDGTESDEKPNPAGNSALTWNGGPACSAVHMKAHFVGVAPGAGTDLAALVLCLGINARNALAGLTLPAAANNTLAGPLRALVARGNEDETVCGVGVKGRAVEVGTGGQVHSDGAGGSASVVGDTILAAESIVGTRAAAPRRDVEVTTTDRDVEESDFSACDINLSQQLIIHTIGKSVAIPSHAMIGAKLMSHGHTH